MKAGTKVRLLSFEGVVASKTRVPAGEDYWRLIGRKGAVVDSPEEKSYFTNVGPDARVCVRFDDDLKNLGLEAHNRIPNSLWIRISDLSSHEEPIAEGSAAPERAAGPGLNKPVPSQD